MMRWSTYIVPRHPCALQDRKRVTCVPPHIFEVHDPGIIVILTGEQGPTKIRRVHICERVIMRVPPPET